MLEVPSSDPVRVSTSLPTSPSSCLPAHVADSWLAVKRESSVGCKCPSSWRESWGSSRMVTILMMMEEGGTRRGRWDIVHSRDQLLAVSTLFLLLAVSTLSESCDRMISRVGAWQRQQGLISSFNWNDKTLLHNKKKQELQEHFLSVNISFRSKPDARLYKQMERWRHCQKRIGNPSFADQDSIVVSLPAVVRA